MGKVCRVALLVSTSIAIFVISVAFSLITWRDFHTIRTSPLSPVPCTVDRSQVLRCPPNPRFTVRVTLLPFVFQNSLVKPNGNAAIAAYPTSDSSECPFATRDAADDFAAKYPPGEEKECYTDGVFISLSPGLAPSNQIYKHLLRTIFPIVAAALSGLLTLYALYRLHVVIRMGSAILDPPLELRVSRLRSMPMDDVVMDNANLDTFGLTRPPSIDRSAGKRPLSRTEAKKLVEKLRGFGDVGAGGTCPICLEDFGDGNGVSEDAVKLPCGHEYHEHCLLEWCQKGSYLCPYCGPYCRLDLLQDDDDEHVVSAAEVSARDAGRGLGLNVDREDLPRP